MAKTYVYGNYIDEVIQIRDHTPATTPEDYWAHQDDLFSVYAVTDAAGAVTQRYLYGDYGTRVTTDPAGTAGFEPALEVDHGFTGWLHDETSGLIEYRHRWMRPEMGRFVQRDPLWYVDGMNVYVYATLGPGSFTDPYGESIGNSVPGCWRCIPICDGGERLRACAAWVDKIESTRGGFSNCVRVKMRSCCKRMANRTPTNREGFCIRQLNRYRRACDEDLPSPLQPLAPTNPGCAVQCAVCAGTLAGLGIACGKTAGVGCIVAAMMTGLTLPTSCVDCLACIQDRF